MPLDTVQFSAATKDLTNLSLQLERVKDSIKLQVNNLNGAVATDPCPETFCGAIEGYRYTTGKRGESPTHRFEVKCGNGLCLHIEASPVEFGAMMADSDMGEITPSKVNGKFIIVRRTDNRIVPRAVLPTENARIDKYGNFVYEDCKVYVPSVSLNAIVIQLDGDGDVLVRFDDDSTSYFNSSNVVAQY